jgi:hypothetical protein
VQIKQHSGHAKAEQPEGRRISGCVFDRTNGLVHCAPSRLTKGGIDCQYWALRHEANSRSMTTRKTDDD